MSDYARSIDHVAFVPDTHGSCWEYWVPRGLDLPAERERARDARRLPLRALVRRR